MDSFTTFQQHARIVNRMVTMHASQPLALEKILPKLPNARYNRARPCRIYWRYQNSIPVQLFPKGTIQILGGRHDDAMCETIRDTLIILLSVDISPPCLRSCTVACRIASHLPSLQSIPSNQHVSNEYELFPGTLIQHPVSRRRRRRFHICLFSNGTAIITGATSLREAYRQLKKCLRRYRICQQ